MRKVIQRFAFFILFFSASMVSADPIRTNETGSEIQSCKKIYVFPDQLAITPNGIFIKFNEHWCETSALFSDAKGIFIRPQDTNERGCRDGYQPCRNCDRCVSEVYDICPLCGKPSRT
jgi:hypothetical protein